MRAERKAELSWPCSECERRPSALGYICKGCEKRGAFFDALRDNPGARVRPAGRRE